MAKLPRSPISEGVTNQYRPVREARASGADPVGQAMEQAGNAGFEIASRIREAQIVAEVGKAQNDLRLKLDAAHRELEKDSEPPELLEQKFRERSQAILGETSGAMSSPLHKRMFEAQSAELVDTYVLKTRDLTRTKQLGNARAEALTSLDDLANVAADADIGRDVLEQNTENTLAMARRYYEVGLFDAEQFAAAEIKANDALRVGISVRNESRLEGLMDAGDAVSIAQARILMEDEEFRAEILPEKREAIEDALKVKAQAASAVGMADKLMAGAGGDYDAAIVEARKIEDVELRLDVESRLTTMKEQDRQGEALRQDKVRMQGLEPLLNGGGLGSIPSAVMMQADADTKKYWKDYVDQQRTRTQQMATLSAEQRAALKAYEVNVVGSIKAVKDSDPDLYNRGPRAWMAESPRLYAQYIALDEDAQAGIEREIESSRTGGGKASAADGIYSQLVAGSTTFGVDLTAMKTENPDRYGQVIGALRNAADQEALALGDGALTVARRKEIFGTVLSTVYKNEGEMAGFRPFNTPVGPLALAPELNASTEERRRALDIAALLPRDYRAARAKLLDKGNANPSEMEVATEALSMRAKQDAKEAPPTFTQGDR
jgi:hypothetical protein